MSILNRDVLLGITPDSTVNFTARNQPKVGWISKLVAMTDLNLHEAELNSLILAGRIGMRVNERGEMQLKQADVAALVAARQAQAQSTKTMSAPKSAKAPKTPLTPAQALAKAQKALAKQVKKAQRQAAKKAAKAQKKASHAHGQLASSAASYSAGQAQPSRAFQSTSAKGTGRSRIVRLDGTGILQAPAPRIPSLPTIPQTPRQAPGRTIPPAVPTLPTGRDLTQAEREAEQERIRVLNAHLLAEQRRNMMQHPYGR